MPKYTNQIQPRLAVVFMILIVLMTLFSTTISGQGPYTDTIAVIKVLHANEISALHNYGAFARKARSENLPGIAGLFDALAKSETIHARNFRAMLETLGDAPDNFRPTVSVRDTRENLKYATQIELADIDTNYPAAIERMRAENHAQAIIYTTYSWQSEKQHRDLIKEIQSGTGLFFSHLKKEFEEEPRTYFICQRCGSILNELPGKSCPICDAPESSYKQLAPQK